jgi:hypothetical protein
MSKGVEIHVQLAWPGPVIITVGVVGLYLKLHGSMRFDPAEKCAGWA